MYMYIYTYNTYIYIYTPTVKLVPKQFTNYVALCDTTLWQHRDGPSETVQVCGFPAMLCLITG